jgi:pimeloyl-ACP methyl ester carboxylesterase
MSAEERLMQMVGPGLSSKHSQVNGYDIHYVTAGDGSPLLLLHGVNIGWGEWYPNIADLSRYFRVYALDLPGAGSSSRISFSTSDLERSFVDTVEKFMEIHDLRDAILIGHSSGGWTALKLALRGNKRIAKLVLVNSLGFSPYLVWRQRPLAFGPVAKFLAQKVMPPTKKNMENFLVSVFVDTSKIKREFIEYYCEAVCDRGNDHPFMLINRFLEPFHIRSEFVLGDALRDVRVPTLIAVSDRDPMSSFVETSRFLDRIPGARVEVFRGAGHVPSIEQAEHFNALVNNFLAVS